MLWIQKWFLSIFLYSFPFGVTLRIWDKVIAEGNIFIYKFAIGILALYEKELLKQDMGGMNELLQSFDPKSSYGRKINIEKGMLERMLEAAEKVTISKEEVLIIN